MDWLSRAKMRGEGPSKFLGEMGAMYRAYQDTLRRCAAVDFDDLLLMGRHLLKECEWCAGAARG